MSRLFIFGLILAAAGVFAPAARSGLGTAPVQAAPRSAFADPGISPDGREIAFVSGGDIWTVPAQGGEARLLVSHAAAEMRPLFSPDGSRLAFGSTRTGNGDIYVLSLGTGVLTRLTWDDGMEYPDSWSRDGAWIYFSSSAQDIAGMNDVYRVRSTGGTPMAVAADRYASEFWGAPSPDGSTIAISGRGNAFGQWWRRGHSHIDMNELHLVRIADTPVYTRVGQGERQGKEMWPMWAADGRSLYYVGDADGAENLWRRDVASGASARLTSYRDGRVLWPSITANGQTIAFERDFGIWIWDGGSRQSRQLAITLRGASHGPVSERLTLTTGFPEMRLSPDGRKVAIIARGEVFAASAKDGGEATRVTRTPAPEGNLAWSPDSRRLAYESLRGGVWKLFMHDFVAETETPVSADGDAVQPLFSPDGRFLAFTVNGSALHLMDLRTRASRVLARGEFDKPPFAGSPGFAFSRDSRWVAYLSPSANGFESVFAVPVDGGTPRQVSFLANAFGRSIAWGEDGTYLLFASGQRTESGQVARVELIARAPRFREDQFRALFPAESSGPPARSPRGAADSTRPGRTPPARVEIEFDGIRRRTSILPVGVDVQNVSISPDGKQALITGGAAGQSNLWLWSLDDLARDAGSLRQLTSTAGGKSSVQWSPDGKEVWFMEGGRVQIITVDNRQTRALVVSASTDVDFHAEKAQVFEQAWTYLRDNFYDETFHGADWEAVRDRTRGLIEGARTPDEMRRLLSLMIGELNASHLGVGSPPAGGGGANAGTGKLGVRLSRGAYEADGAFRIEEVIPLGPLARDAKAGDHILAIDGTPLTPSTNLDQLLAGAINRRVVVRLASGTNGTHARDVAVRPISRAAEKNLIYDAWVDSRRAHVARVSGGRFGYVHMIDMGAGSLAQLYVDLDDEAQGKEGVIVDIRNNNGGFVNAYALDVFSRRPYLTMQYRGRREVGARSQLGQRVFDRPTVLVTNQHSLSDAEDFTEGYRTLGLGKVVGEPTAGWIIYTSNFSLIDGTTLRIPFSRIRGADGKDMELVPRPVDVAVVRALGEHYAGKDTQLDAAVTELSKRTPGRRPVGQEGSRN